MKVMLELLRFHLILFGLLMILGIPFQLILANAGMDAVRYNWIFITSVLLIMFALYKNRGWDEKFDKKLLLVSATLILVFSLFIPDLYPTHMHANKYAYSFGFPFRFLTLYIENGTNYLITNIFQGRITGWNMSMGISANFIIFYFSLRLLLKRKSEQLEV